MSNWSLVGTKTFTPDDLTEVVGSFSMEENADTLWTRVTLLSPATPWPWSYGILGFKTPEGYELGSTKAYAEIESEVFRLGNGRPPSVRDGVLTFAPRGYNLGWIKKGNPLTLKFECASGVTSGGGGQVGGSTLFVPYVEEPELPNTQPDFFIEDGIAYLLFNWFLK
jgi:hypothetical protein